MKRIDIIAAGGITVLVTIATLLVVDLCGEVRELKREAIEHGAAQHNPTTGEFEWIKRELKAKGG